MDFDVSVDHRVNMKKREKGDKYLGLAREPRQLWNIRMTVIRIVIAELGMVAKGLERRLE